MYTLTLGLILIFGGDKVDAKTIDYSWVLDEMNNSIEFFEEQQFSESKIKIFDIDGNMVSEYNQADFIENTLSLSDLRKVQDSDFLFDFEGDSYYLNN